MQCLTKESGWITENVYMLDILQYNIPSICTTFIIRSKNKIAVLDSGTSNETDNIILTLKNLKIDLTDVDYLIPSHYHFDHAGGMWKLWETISKKNKEVKIVTTSQTQERLLHHTDLHLKRARRTFGDFVGIMNTPPLKAFEIVSYNEILPLDFDLTLKIIDTPGHTADHSSPLLLNSNFPEFIYLAEAAGTLFHSSQLTTLPSSMPPDFNYKSYINSLEKLISINALNAGYCHIGCVKGVKNVKNVLVDNLNYSKFFRDYLIKKYNEGQGSTRYIVNEFIKNEAPKRTDLPIEGLFSNTILAVVFGQLIDLGLKKFKDD